MFFKQFAGAVLISVIGVGSAFAQGGDIKGWTPRAPGGGGIAAPPPPPGGAGGPPGGIARGPGDPPPRPAEIGGAGPAGPGAGGAGPGAGGAGSGLPFVHASDAASIQRALQNAGYRAELTTDDEGNPRIIGRASKSTYWIQFLDCNLSIGCAGVQFWAGYSDDFKPTLAELNEFNSSWRYIRASVGQSGNPSLYMEVIIRDGGISERAFSEYINMWHEHFVPAFEQLIGF